VTANPQTFAIAAPGSEEYAPYYGKYISLVPGSDILAVLESQLAAFPEFLRSFREQDAEFRYEPEKWSIKEVLGHVIDAERIFAYRALRIARRDKTPIEGFEQDDYVRYAPFSHCRFADLIEEFSCVRKANLILFRSLDTDAWTQSGTASGNGVTVRALAYIIAGHVLHHRNILEQKYTPVLSR
jgi:DinB family protein